MNEKFYTIDEVAKKIKVHPKTIRRYIYNGKLLAKKIGGQWRIYESELDKYINSTTANSCHGSHTEEDEISQDDFCVFMDNHRSNPDSLIELCIIIDLYLNDNDEIKKVTNDILDSLNEFNSNISNNRYNYIYDNAENKARFVLWGSPSFMESVTKKLKRYERGKL